MASQSFPLGAYALDGLAFVPSSGGAADLPSEQKTQANALNTRGSFAFVAQTLTFSAAEYPCLVPLRGLWEQS